MGGRASREKGKRGERELAKLWQAALPNITVRRTGQDQAHSAVEKPGDIDTGGLYAVEAKRRKRLSWTVIREGLRQAVEAAKPSEFAVLCAREDKGEWVVTIRLADWLRVVALLDQAGIRPGEQDQNTASQ